MTEKKKFITLWTIILTVVALAIAFVWLWNPKPYSGPSWYRFLLTLVWFGGFEIITWQANKRFPSPKKDTPATVEDTV